jgi:hypothetical protein
MKVSGQVPTTRRCLRLRRFARRPLRKLRRLHLPGAVLRLDSIVELDRPAFTLQFRARVARSAIGGPSFFQATCSVSGITRVPATDVMKLVSPDQRGRTWRWTWAGIPGPGRPAQVGPHVQPVGLVGPSMAVTASRVAAQTSADSARSARPAPDVAQGQHQDVPAGVGVGVQDDERPLPRQTTRLSTEGGPLSASRQNTHDASSCRMPRRPAPAPSPPRCSRGASRPRGSPGSRGRGSPPRVLG